MQLTAAEAERLARAGADSLQRGDAGSARQCFEQLVAAGVVSTQILLLLAHARRQIGDSKGEEEALERLLAGDPRNIRGLIMKGDCRARAVDNRAAADFYRAAIAAAANFQLPRDLVVELRRAEALVAEADRQFQNHVEEWLTAKGLSGRTRSGRFQESLDILSGTKQIFVQQPTSYYLPGLPQIQFFDREQFAWVATIEGAFDAIQAEMLAVVAEGDALKPFVRSSSERPTDNAHGLMDNPDWSAFHLWDQGEPIEPNIARCPCTAAALAAVPTPHIRGVAPSIFFSVLRAGARIPPHHGLMNTRLVCHLPLVVPQRCGLRVGNESRAWEPGKLLIFDDSIEHEAWNEADRDRIVLIFEIWRPELTAEERGAVATLFEARESFRGVLLSLNA